MVTDGKPTYLFVTVGEPGTKVIDSEPVQPLLIRSRDTRKRRGPPKYPAQRTEYIIEDPGRLTGRLEAVNFKEEEAPLLEEGSPPGQPSSTWTFLPVDPATAQPTTSARYNIRSHVAKRQHRQRREQEFQLRRSQFDTVVSKRDGGISPVSTSPPSILSSRSSSSFRIQTIAKPPNNDNSITVLAPFPSLMLNPEDPSDQLQLYARQLKTSVPAIWTCYLWQERQHGQLFHAQYSQFKGWGPKYLHPLILANPAILATTVLFTGCLLRHRAGDKVMSDDILSLRSRTYGLVQSAVDSPSSQLSDDTILAVLKLALFEAIFGQLEAYRVHMEGLARMVALRNGMEGLGMDGYLAHLLMWFDANLSQATMSRKYLGAAEGVVEAAANEEVFVLGVELNDVKLFKEILV